MANNLCWAVDARALAAVVGTKAAAADEDADDALMAAERDDRRMGRSILVMVDEVSRWLYCPHFDVACVVEIDCDDLILLQSPIKPYLLQPPIFLHFRVASRSRRDKKTSLQKKSAGQTAR